MRELELLSIVLQTPGCLPPIVWGEPGVGKTQRIRLLAERLGLHLETVIASIREPADFSGLPIPGDDGTVAMAPPAWARRLEKETKGILFLDEASCAAPACQAALLRVVHERVVGDLQLPDGVQVILAANPPDRAAGGWDLAPPLASRLIHLQWGTPTGSEWADWLSGTASDAVPWKIDPERWLSGWARARVLFGEFVRKTASSLSEDWNDAVAGRFPPAFATPRTWEAAARLYASCLSLGPVGDDMILPLLTAAIGQPKAIEVAAWLRANDLPDPEELLAAPEKWEPEKLERDRVYRALAAASHAAVTKNGHTAKQRSARWKAAWCVIDHAIKAGSGQDIGVMAARILASPDNRPEKGALLDDRVRSIILGFSDVIRAAELVR